MAWMLSLKALVISAGVVFVGLALKLGAPLVLELTTCHAPLMWASLLSWLKPPYLYVIINCIIISIVASSRFHHHQSSERNHPDDPMSSRSYAPAEISPDFGVLNSTVAYEQREETVNSVSEVANGSAEEEEEEEEDLWPPIRRGWTRWRISIRRRNLWFLRGSVIGNRSKPAPKVLYVPYYTLTVRF
jgi:hypothetical protein